MRIILTVNYSPWSPYSGGGQRSVHNLAAELGRRGYDVHVIYSKTPFETVVLPEKLPYCVHWALLPAWRSRRDLFLRPLASCSFRSVVKTLCRTDGSPVIVHANGEEASALGGLRKAEGFGLVATPRYSAYPERLTSRSPRSIPDRLRLALFEWKYLAQAKVLRDADRICPPSHWAAGRVSAIPGVDPSKITVIPNGVPYEFLNYRWNGEHHYSPILYFGRLGRDKGVDLLLRAYSTLPDGRPPLLIAGSGDEKGKLEKLGNDLGIGGEIRFTGWLNHHELGETLSNCRMCVLPSREENYSLAILSALAVGVPVISTRTGGTPEIIRDGETGLLVEPEDPDGLAEAMKRLLDHPDEAGALGANGRNDARKEKTWAVSCDRAEEVYRQIVRHGPLLP